MISRTATLPPRTLARLAQFFDNLSDGIISRLAYAVTLDLADGGTGLPHRDILDVLRPRLRRIDEVRQRERSDLLRVLERAPREVRAALPMRTVGGFGGHDAPLDLSQSPAERKFHRAESFAQILAQLNGVAETYGLARRLTIAREETVLSVRAFQRGLIREIRASRRENHAEEYRQHALKLCALLLGNSEVMNLKRARPTA